MCELYEKDVIRIEVEFYNEKSDSQFKKFAIDPRLTNYDVLLGLLIKGFNLKREFLIHYLVTEDFGIQFLLPLLSDWDLDTAILTASDPMLYLKVTLKHTEKGLDDWQIVAHNEGPLKPNKSNASILQTNVSKQMTITNVVVPQNCQQKSSRSNSASLLNQMYQQVEKTVSSMQRVFSYPKLNDSLQNKITKSPMSDEEFKNYMDETGRIIYLEKFRQSVYLGGLEPSLRKVGWRLLLNIYPDGLTGRERLNLLENKTRQYQSLKHGWKYKFKSGTLSESEMAQIALVSVDVIRTDRSLNFYTGENNHSHVCQLFDILATYCICHPSVGYYQGMSDLASPLLYVQCDEAVAYVCFCSLMVRFKENFIATRESNNNLIPVADVIGNGTPHNNQSNMATKLKHFYHLLFHIDRELALFLRERQLDNLYFAHRWILLEMKREFYFHDSLRLLEVQWASLPLSKSLSDPSVDGVPLLECDINDFIEMNSFYSQYCFHSATSRQRKVRCYGLHDMTLLCSLIGQQYTPSQSLMQPNNVATYPILDLSPSTNGNDLSPSTNGNDLSPSTNDNDRTVIPIDFNCDAKIHNEKFYVNEDNQCDLSAYERKLPGLNELGLGNPFLLFLGVSLLLEYRDLILQSVVDASDVMLLYQRLNRRHDTKQVLSRARLLFDHYLHEHNTCENDG